jgi:hypothetical protein
MLSEAPILNNICDMLKKKCAPDFLAPARGATFLRPAPPAPLRPPRVTDHGPGHGYGTLG